MIKDLANLAFILQFENLHYKLKFSRIIITFIFQWTFYIAIAIFFSCKCTFFCNANLIIQLLLLSCHCIFFATNGTFFANVAFILQMELFLLQLLFLCCNSKKIATKIKELAIVTFILKIELLSLKL